MAEENPLAFEEVLRAEYRALRPDSRFNGASRSELFRQASHDPRPFSALCISGGGIRSATFALGAIQALAEQGLLAQFDYLSTVSGGGYIGGWLTAWKTRAKGLRVVVPRLGRDAPPVPPDEPDPIQHLRDYNAYLSPRRGAFSVDLWTLFATVLRNILLNWAVLVPLLMFALMVPRLYVSLLSFPELFFGSFIFPDPAHPNYAAPELDAISESPLVGRVLPGLSALLFAWALFNTLRYLPGLGGRDHTRYDYRTKVLAPLTGAVLAFLAYDSLHYLGRDFVAESQPLVLIAWTVAPAVSAWVLALLVDRRPLGARLRLLFGPLSLAVLFMAAGTGAAVWVTTNFVLWSPDPNHAPPSWAAYVTAGPPLILLGFVLGTVLFVGLSSRFLEDADREWMSRAVAGVLLVSVAWALFSAMVLVVPEWALGWRAWGHGALAVATAISAWLSSRGGGAGANVNPGAAGRKAGSIAPGIAARLAPPVFIALLAGALSVLTNVLLLALHDALGVDILTVTLTTVGWQDHEAVLTRSNPWLVSLLAALLLAVAWVMARFVNVNTFSLNGMYRDRLVRAYLGASNPARAANEFTGFAANDDLRMHELDAGQRPLHVLNLTLNLTSGERLAWQQRKAESFTVSPLHCGNRDLGFRPSSGYGGPRGISLGTAMAISGAAASPNMGYHSSPVTSFIMTLFNARLGAWLGNPGPAGARTWRHPGPRSAIRLMVKEALGRTSNETDYVYLSDGGHFENLGLYEMVLRRCRLIVVLDGGCDPDYAYADLGNALRKIRIDLKVPITLDLAQKRLPRDCRRRCAVGTIHYSAADRQCADGRLVYLKPTCLGNEPPDVASYLAAHAAFPHQSTADQWFDESQTESYRMLGLFTVDEISDGWGGGTLDEWRAHLEAARPRADGSRSDTLDHG